MIISIIMWSDVTNAGNFINLYEINNLKNLDLQPSEEYNFNFVKTITGQSQAR